jgi:alpha-tubulin suppressor-like RCC1 family protein
MTKNPLKLLAIIVILGILAINISSISSAIKDNNRRQELQNSRSNSKIIGWGANGFGQLGIGFFGRYDEEQPYVTIDLQNIRYVSAGLTHSIAVSHNGDVFSWGNNRYGQIAKPFSVERIMLPELVAGLPKIKTVAARQYHSLALSEDGRVYGWGINLSGQLGDGTNTNREAPVLVQGIEDVSDIAAGYRFSLALKKDGTVWGWGALCDPSESSKFKELLKQVASDIVLEGTYFDAGENSLEPESELANCLGEEIINIQSKTPIQIANLDHVNAISAGFGHMLALKTDGTIWTWGCNKYGQVGNGTFENKKGNTVPVQVMGLPKIMAISAGFRHSLALDDNGNVWVWGHNQSGELGTGDMINRSTATRLDISEVKTIYADHDYSVALKNDGSVWGWGNNDFNQLGVTDKIVQEPVKINGLENIQELYPGGGHVYALKQ